MSESGNGSSQQQEDVEGRLSILDFLYQDVNRVGSYLAQLAEAGHATGAKQTLTSGQTGGSDTLARVSGVVAVVKAGADVTEHAGTSKLDVLERTFDPLWRNAIELKEELEERGLLQADLSTAQIGQFVTVTGKLGIIDNAFLQTLFKISETKHILESGLTSHMKPEAMEGLKKSGLNTPAKAARAIISVLTNLPRSTHFRINDENEHLSYGSLLDSGLVSASTDLFLKHGIVVAGDWTVIGILDARPGDFLSDDDEVSSALDLADDMLASLMKAAEGIMRIGGRPSKAYGIAPLLIFRNAG